MNEIEMKGEGGREARMMMMTKESLFAYFPLLQYKIMTFYPGRLVVLSFLHALLVIFIFVAVVLHLCGIEEVWPEGARNRSSSLLLERLECVGFILQTVSLGICMVSMRKIMTDDRLWTVICFFLNSLSQEERNELRRRYILVWTACIFVGTFFIGVVSNFLVFLTPYTIFAAVLFQIHGWFVGAPLIIFVSFVLIPFQLAAFDEKIKSLSPETLRIADIFDEYRAIMQNVSEFSSIVNMVYLGLILLVFGSGIQIIAAGADDDDYVLPVLGFFLILVDIIALVISVIRITYALERIQRSVLNLTVKRGSDHDEYLTFVEFKEYINNVECHSFILFHFVIDTPFIGKIVYTFFYTGLLILVRLS